MSIPSYSSKFFEMMKQNHGYSEKWGPEHHGHKPAHSGSLGNSIEKGGPNHNVYYEGELAATETTKVTSSCSCCKAAGLPDKASFRTYSKTVFICGEPAVAKCDSAFSYKHRDICIPTETGTVYIGS